MEVTLEQAKKFQILIEESLGILKTYPFNQITSLHIIGFFSLIVCSFISYRLGRKEENESLLSENLKKQLSEFESDVEAINKRIGQTNHFLKKIFYLQMLSALVGIAFLVNQGIIDYMDISMIYAGATLLVVLLASTLYKYHLLKRVKQLNFKIQEDKNQQAQIVQKLYAEMTDQMRTILSGMISQTALIACDSEKEGIKQTYEQQVMAIQAKGNKERDIIKKDFEARIQEAAQPMTSGRNQFTSLCSAQLCKTKKKILNEKIKRNDWFIQNVSQFAWCQVCASQMFQDPNRSFISDQADNLQPSLNLDDSILLNTTMQDETIDEELRQQQQDELDGIFNGLMASSTEPGQVIRSDCENHCLTKYFVLCKKIGSKFNEWTERIDTMQDKYSKRKSALLKPASKQ